MDVYETIVAIASAYGGAVRGIVRMTGPKVLDCLQSCFESDTKLPTHSATHLTGSISTSVFDMRIPVSVYVWPNEKSYTRQPTVEIHTIGSPPVLEAVQEEMCRHGARLANPGEFTLRAFLAGRLDLPQAEAVLGLIDASNEDQFKTALTQLAGGVSAPINELRNDLLNALADVEAGMDFVDEDIEFISQSRLTKTIGMILKRTRTLEKQLEARADTNDLPRVVIIGRPNAGKSTLWNRLLNGKKAIVSASPGTTRDYLTSHTVIHGLECLLVDTAGIDTNDVDQIDLLAQQTSQSNSIAATLRIRCIDTQSNPTWPISEAELPASNELIVLTKADVCADANTFNSLVSSDVIRVSSHTGQGINELKHRIAEKLNSESQHDTFSIASTASRCRESIRLVNESLDRAFELAEQALGDELVAAELRVALSELATLVGAVYTDDILDRIFSKFCIGK